MKKIALFLIAITMLAPGCAINRATAISAPGIDLSKTKSFYIVEESGDKGTNNIYKIIKMNLVKRGYTVTTGRDMQSPYKTDVILTYVDRWMWDMSMYMIELKVTFIDPINNLPMARGNSLHTSLTRLSAEEMVDEVLTNIFDSTKSNP